MQVELRAIYLKSQIREFIHSSLVVLFPAKQRQVIDAKVITDRWRCCCESHGFSTSMSSRQMSWLALARPLAAERNVRPAVLCHLISNLCAAI